MSRQHHKRQNGSATTAQPVAAARANDANARVVSVDDIRRCAYQKWEDAGKPHGDGVQFWLEAEQELLHGK